MIQKGKDTYVCDTCGKKEEVEKYDSPKGWFEIYQETDEGEVELNFCSWQCIYAYVYPRTQ